MTKQYQRSLAPSLRTELSRLESGNKAERQRYVNAVNAILKVLAHPLSREFSKDLPDGYKAVDVLQQYRLFFKVVEGLQDFVVHFVWINTEDSLHRTGKPDDCYEVFRKLIEAGKIEEFIPPREPDRNYKFHGTWASPVVYVSYTENIGTLIERADSHLHLSQISEKEFRFESITVSKEDVGLASGLLNRLCDDADTSKIMLTFDLFLKMGNAEKSRHLLQKFGFNLSEAIDDVELWVRIPNNG